MDLAKKLNAADEYLKLDRNPPEKQWEGFKEKHPYGFDVVVEATGSHAILEKTIDFCTRGGKLVYYGVYEKEAVVKYFRPSSFSEMWCVGRSVKYLDSRKVDVRGIVDKTIKLEEFGKVLDAVRSKECIKAAIVFD